MDDDSGLLDAAKRMDQEALVSIFDLYSAALFNYALRLSGDPVTADHIVGDVFARLLERFSSGQGPNSNLRSYLYQSAYHLLIDEVRSSRRSAPLEVASTEPAELHTNAPSLEDQIMLKQVLQIIRTKLTTDQRHVIVLRFLEGFNLQETSMITGKRVDHVKVIQGRAIAALRKALDQGGIPLRPSSSGSTGISRAASSD